MVRQEVALLKERATLRIVVAALVASLVGVALLYISSLETLWTGREALQAVARNIGGFLFATLVLALLWEIWGKRAFLDEILAKVQLSRDIQSAGIVKFTDNFHEGIDWRSYFRTATKIDIFFAYGQTWRNTYLDEFRRIASNPEARVRVVLPDPDDDLTIKELARRFNYTPDQLRGLVRDAENYFKRLRPMPGTTGAQVDIWFLPGTQQFSFYRFDHIAIVALYSHRRERIPVPAIACEDGGTLYDYIRKEFDAMTRDGGMARKVS